MPLDWIIAFRSSFWYLLISIEHFSRCNSRLQRYLHISRVVLIDTAFCRLEQYRCAALKPFFSICCQVLLVAMASWWNASSLLRAVKRPHAPRPFKLCFIISVPVMWLVCTMATPVAHTHVHSRRAVETEKYFAIMLSSCVHTASELKGWCCCGVTLWRDTYRAEVRWITPWERAVFSAQCVPSLRWSEMMSLFWCFSVPLSFLFLLLEYPHYRARAIWTLQCPSLPFPL